MKTIIIDTKYIYIFIYNIDTKYILYTNILKYTKIYIFIYKIYKIYIQNIFIYTIYIFLPFDILYIYNIYINTLYVGCQTRLSSIRKKISFSICRHLILITINYMNDSRPTMECMLQLSSGFHCILKRNSVNMIISSLKEEWIISNFSY